MTEKEIKSILKSMAVGAFADIADTTYAVRTTKKTWSICDNGEEVRDCDLQTAIRIVAENLS